MDVMFLIKTVLEFLNKGAWLPLSVFIIVILLAILMRKSDKREKYLLDAIDKKEAESKTDKEALLSAHKENQTSLMGFIDKQNKLIESQNHTNTEVVHCIQDIRTQIKSEMDKVNIRLDYIEEKIDRQKIG